MVLLLMISASVVNSSSSRHRSIFGGDHFQCKLLSTINPCFVGFNTHSIRNVVVPVQQATQQRISLAEPPVAASMQF
jgi:hypothetical protein